LFLYNDAITGQIVLLCWSAESSTLEEISQETVVLFLVLLLCHQRVLGRHHCGVSLAVVAVAILSLLLAVACPVLSHVHQLRRMDYKSYLDL
jgi:uncharacterized membrane protein